MSVRKGDRQQGKLEVLNLAMNLCTHTLNHKTQIYPLRQGVHFLQWKFVLTETGKVLMLMDNSKVTRQRRRMKKLWEREQEGTVLPGTTRESLRAFLANAARGQAWKIQEKMKREYRELTGREFV